MQQIMQILRKDLRRFWPEIAISLALLAAYSWAEPFSWLPPDWDGSTSNYWRYNGSAWLAILLYTSWMVMVVRVIHEESLAGDRHFWVTRPYEWRSLLATKILFVLVAVNVPLLIAQTILLAAGGFAPLHYVAGLLWMHLLLLAWLFLPVATLAVLTSGVTQLARALLVVLLFLFGGVTLSSTVPGLAAWPGDSLWNWLQYALIFGGLITIIMRQYARRRTANARWLLLGWALVTAAFTAAIPYRTLIARKYPLAAGEQLPFHMLLDTGGQPSRVAAITDAEKNLRFQLPISAGDVAGKDNVVHLEALMVTLEAPDGDQWSSGWQPRSKILWRRDEPNETIWWSGLDTEVRISRRFFDHVKNVPIKVRVAAAATLFHRKEGTLITQTQSDFAIPGVGMCVIDHGPGARLAWCRSPLRIPMMLEVSGQVFGRCPPEKDGLVAQSTEFVSNLAPWLENFGLSPVKVFTPYLTITKPENVVLSVCPGMPLTFSPSETAGQIRVEAEFNDITLANYWAGRFLRGSSGTSPGLGVFAH